MKLVALEAALAARVPAVAPVDRIPQEHLPPGGFARAGVLVPLYETEGDTFVVLTRRRADLRRHAGQISFPGGRLDPGETPLDAALREAREEIALAPDAVHVLGQLGETLVLQSAFRLTPWVASVPYPYPYEAAPGEVEEILHVPLSALSAPGAHRVEPREVYGISIGVHYFAVGEEVIWGATARVLAELVSIWRTL